MVLSFITYLLFNHMKITRIKGGFNFKISLPFWLIALLWLVGFIIVSNLIDKL